MTPSQNRPDRDNVYKIGSFAAEKSGSERRVHRRHDLEQHSIEVSRVENGRDNSAILGKLLDLSAGGARIRASKTDMKPDRQIRVRIELPSYAGICPFVDTSGAQPEPKREWVGWMTVARVQEISNNEVDVAGQLIDMDDMDRGMLGLYLSTQPLAA